MNIRSLTRGDGVLIGAAVVLFIASFLGISGCDGPEAICEQFDSPNSWEASPLGWGSFFLGIAGAALVVLSRALPQPRKVAGLELGQVGAAFTIASAWTLLMWIFESQSAGAGLILGLIASLVLAGAAVAAPLVPALKAPLVGAPRPQTPQPYGMQPGQPGPQGVPGGYGYPGAQHPQYGGQQDPSHGAGQPFGAQAGAPQPQAPHQPEPQAQAAQAQPASDFAPFWFAVPVARQLYAEDGSQAPIAELAPGTWYLAVEQRGAALVAQTQDGRRGVLQDTTGIQRG
ncbi:MULTISPECIES: DUF5336 domain-containing protein [Streptomyces]|uniref:DUF5336 domain-containing protein n=1 Tax=Streptomyces TaxID=1883 RepID=UPI00093DD0EC|nr:MULTISPECIES: DUF5336 domain-containing protein [Streptomyces]MBX9425534.1 DUF5336 domain-containing protein [Streptomyces lateritius]OKJ69322.1 hypothetical protein AMK29_02470 [Streptomyces sp. CB02261]